MKNIIKNQVIDEQVKKYQKAFFDYIDTEHNDATLNKIFTEITILRIKLDWHDSILANYVDWKKLNENCNKKELIKYQFEDVVKTSKIRKYKQEDYKLINNVMNNILPQKQQSNWNLFWEWIEKSLDNVVGRKK